MRIKKSFRTLKAFLPASASFSAALLLSFLPAAAASLPDAGPDACSDICPDACSDICPGAGPDICPDAGPDAFRDACQDICPDVCQACRTELRAEIAALAGGVDAGVGVAVIFPDGDTLTLNGDRDFPLMSVFKFHQALAVCDWLRHRGIPLTEKVEVAPGDLEENTWSPLRDAHPEGGSFSYAELMTFTLVSSDNNACDILFRKTLGVGPVQKYVESLGIGGFSLECNESMMHEDLANCYRNMSTPMSAARLMEKFWQMRDDDEYTRFIWDTMTQCDTGHGRIPARIMGRAAAIAHKTGTGDVLPDGRIIVVNDVGAVVLPDGRCLFLAVFVSDAACEMARCEALIADVAAAVYAAAVSASGLLP